MDYTEAEFKEWLKLNRKHFKYGYPEYPAPPDPYTADEVIERAVLVGFNLKMTYPILSHYQDYLNDTDIDRRATAQGQDFETTLQIVAQMKIDLAKPAAFDTDYLWKRAKAYLITGEEEVA